MTDQNDTLATERKGTGRRKLAVTSSRARKLRNASLGGVLFFGAAAALTGVGGGGASADTTMDANWLSPGVELMRKIVRGDEAVEEGGATLDPNVRRRSEEKLKVAFDSFRDGLWDEGAPGGVKEDYQGLGPVSALADGGPDGAEGPAADPDEPLPWGGAFDKKTLDLILKAIPVSEQMVAATAPIQVSLPPSGGFATTPAQGSGAPFGNSSITARGPGPFFGGGGGGGGALIPIGGIESPVVRDVLPIIDDGEGNGELGDEDDGETPSTPSFPINDPSVDAGEVPVPAAFLLFPAGLAALRWVKKRAN